MPSNIFAKLSDIKGESPDSKHKDEIEVLSYSWGVANSVPPAGGGGGGAGKTTFHDFSFVHHIDKASPSLMRACASGTHLKEAIITSRKAGKPPLEYMVVKFYDVLISSVSPSSTAGQPDTGSEMVTMSFAKVDLGYKVQKPDGTLGGSVDFKHDLTTGKTF